MANVTRSSFKGYTYQQYVFTLIVAIMDVNREIESVEAEADIEENFDDLCIVADKIYRVQVKNYPNTTLADIKVENEQFIIKKNKNVFNPDDNNVVFINTDRITCNTTFMGMDAFLYEGITIVPLLPENIETLLDGMFSRVERENQIVQFAYKQITTGTFITKIEDLPGIVKLSTNLEQKTVILRQPLDVIEKGITWIVGKPGIGKSHYVNELMEKYRNSILYRFWVGSMDENLRKRLDFDTFLDELALNVFDSPKSYTYDELVNEINSKEELLIIDGLDHVENYNERELDKYIVFLSDISEASVVLLSRPLKKTLEWNNIELINWSYDETSVYLKEVHDIHDFNVVDKIFSVTNGYPIITYFIAEHYKITGEINVSTQIDHINQYYDELLELVDIKQALSIFATNNSFFLETELLEIMESDWTVKIIKEFVEAYPYLFNRVRNRISLMHDSLNTYLRECISDYEDMKKLVNTKVMKSLDSLEVQYMARMSAFDLDDRDHEMILLKYCERENFERILNQTLDFESISSFYKQLQKLLEKHEHIYNIYQYYSFALIYQIVNRNDLIDQERLVYEILLYMKKHGKIEEQLFSTGIIWYTYLLLKTDSGKEYESFLAGLHHMPGDIYGEIEKELYYYEPNFNTMDEITIDNELNDKKKTEFDKQDLIIEQLISTWINNECDNDYYTMIQSFLAGDEMLAIEKMRNVMVKYNIRDFWAKRVLQIAKYRLNELGFFQEKNIFRNKSLAETIKENAVDGSFCVADNVLSYIRLANMDNREIDILSVNQFWIMYYEHKDYTVVNIDEALLSFERKNLIAEQESVDMIKSAMKMSDKGIRYLLSDYISKKTIEFVKQHERKSGLTINDVQALDIESINQLNENTIEKYIQEKIRYNSVVGAIDFGEIYKLLLSNWKALILRYLSIFSLHVRNVDVDFDVTMFDEYGITYGYGPTEEDKEYVPFDHGCIHELDYDYIVDNKVNFMEVSRYLDGWYKCFPYVEVYLLYEKEEIQRNYINIIHSSMFARVSKLEYIGSWNLLAGNIPRFLDLFEIEVDWNCLFDIFMWFIKLSCIYDYK